MSGSYTAEERHRLEEAVRAGATPRCPACGAVLARREVPPKRELPYVRRRIWLICPACKRSAAVDDRRGG
ncbi:MAG TPA: hypothetical protein VFQ38_24055 [Longimicrobiales bacterium]|nr:hypothetical protein [Longimicrobiales bacterium]